MTKMALIAVKDPHTWLPESNERRLKEQGRPLRYAPAGRRWRDGCHNSKCHMSVKARRARGWAEAPTSSCAGSHNCTEVYLVDMYHQNQVTTAQQRYDDSCKRLSKFSLQYGTCYRLRTVPQHRLNAQRNATPSRLYHGCRVCHLQVSGSRCS